MYFLSASFIERENVFPCSIYMYITFIFVRKLSLSLSQHGENKRGFTFVMRGSQFTRVTQSTNHSVTHASFLISIIENRQK